MRKVILLMGALAATSCASDYNRDTHGNRYDSKGSKYERKTDRFFDRIDTNDDGVLTRKEYNAFSNNMFEASDVNNDNVVSRDEFRDNAVRDMRNYKHEYRDGYYYDDDYPHSKY